MINISKPELLAQLIQLQTEKCQDTLLEVNKTEEAKNSDSKSTAGDKHETGRAMVQIEIDKLKQQLHLQNQTLQTLRRIEPNQAQNQIGLGSLVQTKNALYFISAAVGKINFEKETVFCISLISPIGQLLLGKKEGDSFTFNGVEQHIIKVS